MISVATTFSLDIQKPFFAARFIFFRRKIFFLVATRIFFLLQENNLVPRKKVSAKEKNALSLYPENFSWHRKTSLREHL